MPGGLLQLISYGYQDKILIENPEITLFKKVYHQTTSFAIEHINYPIQLSTQKRFEQIIIPRKGDLLKNLNFKIELPTVHFEYKEPIITSIKKNLNILSNSNISYNINKLKVLEVFLYNNIKAITNNNTNEENVQINRVINGDVILTTTSFELFNYSFFCNELTTYSNENKINNGIINDFILKNELLQHLLIQNNIDNILSKQEQLLFKNELNSLKLLNNNASTKLQHLELTPINNITLKINNILSENLEISLLIPNISNYINSATVSELTLFNNVFESFVKNLYHSIILSNEIFSYHYIINTPVSTIRNLTFQTNPFYTINTSLQLLQTYNYPIIIIIENNEKDIIIKSIKQITNIITNLTTLISCIDLLTNYDEIDNTYFIACSENSHNLLNFDIYIPILSYIIYDISIFNTPFIADYIINVRGNHIAQFIYNKIAYIFSEKISNVPFDYYYNQINNDTINHIVVAFLVINSNYDSITNITTIYVNKINNTAISTDDKIYITHNNKLNINSIEQTYINTDVENNYIKYNNLIETISDENFKNNLPNVLIGTIKNNSSYLQNCIREIFNKHNFFANLIDIVVTKNTFTSVTFSRPTINNIEIDNMINIILQEIITLFTVRTLYDTSYNHYFDYIKSLITSLTQDYLKLIISFNNSLYNIGDTTLFNCFNTINNITTNLSGTNIPLVNNLKIDSNKGPGILMMYIKSNVSLVYEFDYYSDIVTNNYTHLTYINDINNKTIKYNQNTYFNNNTYKNITNISSVDNSLYIIDNKTQVYNLFNSKTIKYFADINTYSKLFINENVLIWSKPIKTFNYMLYQFHSAYIGQYSFIIEKNVIPTFNTTNLTYKYTLYYISKLYDIIELNFNFRIIPNQIFNINDDVISSYFMAGTYNNKNIIVNMNIINETISFIEHNMYSLKIIIDYATITNYYYIKSLLPTKYEYHFLYNNISNSIYIYAHNSIESAQNIIDLHFLIDVSGTSLLNMDDEIKIINIQIFSLSYLSTYVDNLDDAFRILLYVYSIKTNEYKLLYFELKFTNIINFKFKLITNLTIETDIIYYETPIEIFYNEANYIFVYKNKYIIKNTLLNTISIKQFDYTIKFARFNNNYLVIYLNDIFQLYIINIESPATPYINIVDDIVDIDIKYQYNNNSNSIAFIQNNIIIYYVVSITDNSIQLTNRKQYNISQDTTNTQLHLQLNNIDNDILSLTTTNIIKYNILTDNDSIIFDKKEFNYNYGNDHVNGNTSKIIFSKLLKQFTILDLQNNRYIYGKYSLNGFIINLYDIKSTNIISTQSIFLISNTVIEYNYTIDYDIVSAIVLIIGGQNMIHLISFDKLQYIYKSSVSYVLFNNLIDITYDENNNLIYCINDTVNINVYKINIKLSNILTINTLTASIIYSETAIPTNKYNIYSNYNIITFHIIDTIKQYNNTTILKIDDVASNYKKYIIHTNNTFNQHVSTIPYNTQDIIFSNIKKICPISNNEFILLNNTELYYIYETNITKIQTDVKTFDISNGILYICAGNTSNHLSIFNYKNDIPYSNLIIEISLLNLEIETYEIKSMSDINYNNKIIIYGTNELYIYNINEITNCVPIYKYNYYNTYTAMIKDIQLSQYNFNNLIAPYDTTVICFHILDTNNNINLFLYSEIDSVISLYSNIKFAIPYYLLNTITDTGEGIYNEAPQINYPILQYIEYKNGIYTQHIIGNTIGKIKFNVYETTSNNIYKISYNYIPSTLNLIKNVDMYINENTHLTTEYQIIKTYQFVKYNMSDDELSNAHDIITTNNVYNYTNDFAFNKLQIDVFNINEKVLATGQFTNTYMIGNNIVGNIEYNNSSIFTKINNTIQILYNISLKVFDSFHQQSGFTYYLICAQRNIEYIPLTYVSPSTTLANVFIYYQSISIFPNNSIISAITNLKYYNLNIITYQETVEEDGIVIVKYKLSSKLEGIYKYLFINYNNEQYLASINANESDILNVYYKTLHKITWNTTDNIFKSYLFVEYNENSLYKRHTITNTNVDYTKLNTYFNGNVIILDYIYKLSQHINEFNYKITYYEEDLTTEKLIIQKPIENTILNTIINDIYTKCSNILISQESYLSNTNGLGNVHKLYTLYTPSTNIDKRSFYLTITNFFNNTLDYNQINSHVISEYYKIIFKSYIETIYTLFANKYDYIIISLEITTYKLSQSQYSTYHLLEYDTIIELLNYIYVYIRKLLTIANMNAYFTNFIELSNNNSYFLINNLTLFKKAYNIASIQYVLCPWNVIEQCIIYIHYGILNLLKILHGHVINVNDNDIYLLNDYFTIPYSNININIVKLNTLNDDVVVSYFETYINNFITTYEFNNILKVQTDFNNLFYTFINKLFNLETIGSTSYNLINKLDVRFDLNFKNILTLINNIPIHNYDPFIEPFTHGILNLNTIIDYITKKQSQYIYNYTTYANNNKILTIQNNTYNDMYSIYDTYKSTIITTNIIIISHTSNSIIVSDSSSFSIGDELYFETNAHSYIYIIVSINLQTNEIIFDEPVNLILTDLIMPYSLPGIFPTNEIKLMNSILLTHARIGDTITITEGVKVATYTIKSINEYTQIIVLDGNNTVLPLYNEPIKLVVDDIATLYPYVGKFVKSIRNYTTIVKYTDNSIFINKIGDLKMNDYIGFKQLSIYKVFKVISINYDNNEITLNNTNALPYISLYGSTFINNTIVINDIIDSNIINGTIISINFNNINYAYAIIDVIRHGHTYIKVSSKIPISWTSVNYNNTLPLNNAIATNTLIKCYILINNFVDIDKDSLNIGGRNKQTSLISTSEIKHTISYELFNNFDNINNISYSNSSYNYWYYPKQQQLKYFEPYNNIDNELLYNSHILSNIKSKYKIEDINILKKVYYKTFTVNKDVMTIDNIIYQFSQIINNQKEQNLYYKYLFIIYILNTFFINHTQLYEHMINIHNIEFIIDMFHHTSSPISDDLIDVILKIANNTTNPQQYIYNIYLLPHIPISNSYAEIEYSKYSIILQTDVYHDYLYPYQTSANNDKTEFNLARNLETFNTTLYKKFNDIYETIQRLKQYPLSSTKQTNQIMNILLIDKTTKSISKLFVNTLLSNSLTMPKFDLFNSISYTDSIIHSSITYTYPHNSILFLRDVIIDTQERSGYIRYKLQQLLLFSLLINLDKTNKIKKQYYQQSPTTMLYTVNSNTIDELTDIQYNYIFDNIIGLLFSKKMFIYLQNITEHITDNYSNLFITNDNSISAVYAKINDFINSYLVNLNPTISLDSFTNLVLPTNPYYIAYIINKYLLNSYTVDTEFVYYDGPFKKNIHLYTKRKYTTKQLQFLKEQKYSTEFDIAKWIGEIDGVSKKYLCNKLGLFDEMISLRGPVNQNNIFVSILSFFKTASIINSEISLLNYFLMIFSNEHYNYIESFIIESPQDAITFPTLYLIDGNLIRITNLPDNYYYTIETVSHLTSMDVIQINKLSYNSITNTSKIQTFDIYQNTITNCIKFISNTINKLYLQSDFILNPTSLLNISDSFFSYSYSISSITNNIIIINTLTTDIQVNSYFYIVHELHIKYYFIEMITNNTYSINIELSDNITYLQIGTVIYGGILNICNTIFENNDSLYLVHHNIIKQYNTYSDLSSLLKQYMHTFIKYTSTNITQLYSLNNTTFLNELLVNLINNQESIRKVSINLLKYDNLLINEISNVSILQNNILLLSNVQLLLNEHYNTINNSRYQTNSIMSLLLTNIKYPYNEYIYKIPQGAWIKYIGHFIFNNLSLFIGDELLQQITNDYLHINFNINVEKQKEPAYLNLIGYRTELIEKNPSIPSSIIHVLIPWFFSNNGMFLPLIALLHSNLHINIQLTEIEKLFVMNDDIMVMYDTPLRCSLLLDYVVLDTFEKEKFATNRHEYIIEQIQYMPPMFFDKTNINNDNIKIKLNLINSIKDIFWYCQTDSVILSNELYNYSYLPSNLHSDIINIKHIYSILEHPTIQPFISKITQKFADKYNIHNIDWTTVNLSWFDPIDIPIINTLIQQIDEFNNANIILKNNIEINGKSILNSDEIYSNNIIAYQKYKKTIQTGLYIHSFSQTPIEKQPSGSLNCSLITDLTMSFNVNQTFLTNTNYLKVQIIARNYNVLRLFSGFGACIF